MQTFESFGKVLQYRLDVHPGGSSNKGRGFIQLDTPEAAQAAVKALDGLPVEGGGRLKVSR